MTLLPRATARHLVGPDQQMHGQQPWWAPSRLMCQQLLRYSVLTSSAQPFPARMVERIRSGQIVEMRDLPTDNISLLQHLEQIQPGPPSSQQVAPPPRPSRPREISSLMTWIYCFVAYCAIHRVDPLTQDMLTYAHSTTPTSGAPNTSLITPMNQRPAVVDATIQRECQAGRLLGPIPHSLLPLCQVSPIGLVPKSQPGQWRLIVDLSFPEGHSITDEIGQDVTSIQYARLKDVAQTVRVLGRRTLLTKLDLKSAYRVVPVHRDDWPFLAIQLERQTYLDTALPFGLRSAPKLFSAIANAVAWGMWRRTGGVSGTSYTTWMITSF